MTKEIKTMAATTPIQIQVVFESVTGPAVEVGIVVGVASMVKQTLSLLVEVRRLMIQRSACRKNG